MSSISSGTTLTTALVQTADTSGVLQLQTNGTTTAVTIDTNQNVGVGVTPSAWVASTKALQVGTASLYNFASNNNFFSSNAYYNGTAWTYIQSTLAAQYQLNGGAHVWYSAPSGTAGNAITFTQAMTLDASSNLLVGTTSNTNGYRGVFSSSYAGGIFSITTVGASQYAMAVQNTATTGDNFFVAFGTEASFTTRGSITFNRTAGLTAYNTTSDYRAKDISGPVTDSGALIDSVPVYVGKIKGATQERPMFIAHETPAYAHTGEKDAVDADGKPVYQQMDASALVPVMWAEIQSLRKRILTLENK